MADPKKLSDEMMENVVGGLISQDQALQHALQHAGLNRGQVDFVKKVELDYEHGRRVYEIKFYKGAREYEYDIDAENGQVLKFEQGYDD